MVKLTLSANLEAQLTKHETVRKGALDKAEKIAHRARDNTPVVSGAARDSIRVEEDDDKVYVVAGDDVAFYFGQIEFGGGQHRPAPMPLRRAAEAEGNFQSR